MRGLSIGALLAASVVGGAASGQVASANIRLEGVADAEALVLKFDVHESEDACGYSNVTIGGSALPEEGHGALTLGDGVPAVGRWKSICTGDEQFLLVTIDSIEGNAREGVEFVVRFRQTAPVELLDIAGPATLNPIEIKASSLEDVESVDETALTREDVEFELAQDFAELDMLRFAVADLEDIIRSKESLVLEMSPPKEVDVDVPETCQGVLCFLKGLFDRVTGLGHPGRGRWPHKGHCGNHTHGNHTRGNHTFPHPPWWRGNHTHGNHTFPHPPWWHGNHTHGNHTRPPFHRPPFFCRPHHRPGKPPHGKPPHGKPPHGKPPHGKPPHWKPPHGKPPHGKPPFDRPPFELPHREHQPKQQSLSSAAGHIHDVPDTQTLPQGPLDLYHTAQPLVKLGVLVTLVSALIIALHARCCAGRNRMTWEERREARRAFRQERRAALRRRWIAFLDMLRPEEEYGHREEEGRMEKAGMLVEDADEKTHEALEEEKMVEAEEQEEGIMSMSMSQEIASFQDVAAMVSEMVAAKERRME